MGHTLEQRIAAMEAVMQQVELPKSSKGSVGVSKGKDLVLRIGGGSIFAVIVSGGIGAINFVVGALGDIQTEQTTIREAIIDTRILVVESHDHVEELVKTALPHDDQPPEPETLKKARKQAARVKAAREVFPEAELGE